MPDHVRARQIDRRWGSFNNDVVLKACPNRNSTPCGSPGLVITRPPQSLRVDFAYWNWVGRVRNADAGQSAINLGVKDHVAVASACRGKKAKQFRNDGLSWFNERHVAGNNRCT